MPLPPCGDVQEAGTVNVVTLSGDGKPDRLIWCRWYLTPNVNVYVHVFAYQSFRYQCRMVLFKNRKVITSVHRTHSGRCMDRMLQAQTSDLLMVDGIFSRLDSLIPRNASIAVRKFKHLRVAR